jgi:hypothetical protein
VVYLKIPCYLTTGKFRSRAAVCVFRDREIGLRHGDWGRTEHGGMLARRRAGLNRLAVMNDSGHPDARRKNIA